MQTVSRLWPLVVLGVCLPLSGCMHPVVMLDEGARFARDLRLIDNHVVSRGHSFVLPADRSIYVAESLPSVSGTGVSGLARQTSRAMTEYFPGLSSGTSAETYPAALRSARKHGADYLLYPQTMIWDDDVGGWSDLVAWLRRRDPAIQGVAPDSAQGTSAIRARQLAEKAGEQARENREAYFEWRKQNATSDAERAEIQALQSDEQLQGVKNQLVNGTRSAMQWVHERAKASANWVRSRDLDALGRDQVGMRLVLAESRTGEIVETVILSGQSGVLTFLGDRPGELIDRPLQEYAKSLAGISDSRTYAFQRIPF